MVVEFIYSVIGLLLLETRPVQPASLSGVVE